MVLGSSGLSPGSLRPFSSPPHYPFLARSARIEGDVTFAATIAQDGSVKDSECFLDTLWGTQQYRAAGVGSAERCLGIDQRQRTRAAGAGVDAIIAIGTASPAASNWTLSNATGTTSAGTNIAPAWTKLSYFGNMPVAQAQFASTALRSCAGPSLRLRRANRFKRSVRPVPGPHLRARAREWGGRGTGMVGGFAAAGSFSAALV